jgi:hypothetical protein
MLLDDAYDIIHKSHSQDKEMWLANYDKLMSDK